jgi:hypothetical protein
VVLEGCLGDSCRGEEFEKEGEERGGIRDL